MTKFWPVVTILLLIGVGLVFFQTGEQDQGIDFKDLETECRYDRGSQSQIDLTTSDRFEFSGYFPANNPESVLRYNYEKTEDSVRLNVQTISLPVPSSFWGNCLASTVYKAETEPIEPGVYNVRVFHNGNKVSERVYKVN